MDHIDWEDIADIMVAKRIGQITEPEQECLDRWLGESQANRSVYERFMRGKSLEVFRREFSPDPERAIAGINARIGKRSRRRTMLRVSSAAAVLLIGMFIGLRPGSIEPEERITADLPGDAARYEALLSFGNGPEVKLRHEEQGAVWQKYAKPDPAAEGVSNNAEVQNVIVRTPVGKEYRLELDDGTVVWLNGGTALEYPKAFGPDKRSIKLEGEAYFEVARDPARPFGITLQDNVDITVLGTKFNVCSYEDFAEAQVTLLEGSVAVGHGASQVTLIPNQQAVFDRAGGELSMRNIPDAANYIAWINGQFDFVGMPLRNILESMAQWYGINIVYENFDVSQAGLFTIKVSRHDKFSSILDILHYVTGLDYRLEGSTVTISSDRK